MSVELEWELYDIFDSGMFAFPIYDHNSARKIVRYLLMRGILHEEIAEAIEDSTGDLMTWLNRNGKHKVGEWVIAWVNDCREDFDRGELHKIGDDGGGGGGGGDVDFDFFLRDELDADDDDDVDGGGGGADVGELERRSDSRITELESISSQAATSRSSAETLDTCKPPAPGSQGNQTRDSANQRDRDIYGLSPRTLAARRAINRSGRPNDLDLTECSSSNEALYEAPDSGHFSDLYTNIPSDAFSETTASSLSNNNTTSSSNNNNSQCAANLLGLLDECQLHSNNAGGQKDDRKSGTLQCTCSVAHYSYVRKAPAPNPNGTISDLARAKRAAELLDAFFGDAVPSPGGATQLELATVDRDGPGFVYIMTDSIINCLPWSSERRYKIAASRQPDRCLLDFRSKHVDVDLIWQVKVTQHLKAVREIHALLDGYNLHSNWFKCSLSLIMDTVSKVVKQYK